MRLSPSICAERANNSFKPNLLRYGKGMAEKACHTFAFTTQVGLTQALGRKMKFTGGSVSVGLAVLGSYLFLSGIGGLWVDLVPSDPEAIAAARDRGYTFLFTGVIVMLVAATVGGLSARTSPKLALISSTILAGASLFPLIFWLFG